MVSGEDTEGPHATLLVESIEKCKPQSRFLGNAETVGPIPHHGFTTARAVPLLEGFLYATNLSRFFGRFLFG